MPGGFQVVYSDPSALLANQNVYSGQPLYYQMPVAQPTASYAPQTIEVSFGSGYPTFHPIARMFTRKMHENALIYSSYNQGMVFTDKIIVQMSGNSMTLLLFLLVFWLHHLFNSSSDSSFLGGFYFKPVRTGLNQIGKANTPEKQKY